MQEYLNQLPPFEVLAALLALTLCALVMVRFALRYVFVRETGSLPRLRIALEAFFWGVGVFLACYLAADCFQVSLDRLDRSYVALLTIAAAITVSVFALLGWWTAFGIRSNNKMQLRAVRALHFLLLSGMAFWFASRTQLPIVMPMLDDVPMDSLSLMEESPEYLCVTDAGTTIPVFEIDLRKKSDETRTFIATSIGTPKGSRVIPRADASVNANCHGWVFTGGKYLLRGRGVDQILTDNGYTVQGSPAAADLIVYRNESGDVLHTGIVSGILLDGTCIIESKWGISGRYLHQAEDQPYGLNYAFYRSERGGHLVTVLHRSELDGFLTNLSASDYSSSAAVDAQPALPLSAAAPSDSEEPTPSANE